MATLVAGYHLNGNSTDFSGNNNHGTDTAITYSQANGKFNQGGGFNGSSSLVAIANSASLQITGALTITAWIKTNDATPNKNMVIYSKGNQNSAAGLDYSLTVQNRKIRILASNGSATVDLTAASTMTDAQWHYIVFTYTPSTSGIAYLDGKQDGIVTASVIASIQSTTHAAAIGRDGDVAQNYFSGALDEVQIYNVAKDARWVRQQYALGVGKFY